MTNRNEVRVCVVNEKFHLNRAIISHIHCEGRDGGYLPPSTTLCVPQVESFARLTPRRCRDELSIDNPVLRADLLTVVCAGGPRLI